MSPRTRQGLAAAVGGGCSRARCPAVATVTGAWLLFLASGAGIYRVYGARRLTGRA